VVICRTRVSLNQAFTDGAGDIVLGRRPLSDYDQLLKDWQTNGGNQIRTELRQAVAITQ
jgi:putative aldouronate transport system substrate-binding protein